MNSEYNPYRELLRLTMKPVFLLVDLFGIACLMATHFIHNAWGGACAAIGSAFLTIGVSLPIALYYQLRTEAESMRIIDSCHRAGIKAIYRSRHADSQLLRQSLDVAVSNTNNINLMGVAFRNLFDSSGEHTESMIQKLDNPEIHIRVLLLDPGSNAAKLRAEIEKDNTTIADIQHTIKLGIPCLLQERLKKVCGEQNELKSKINTEIPWSEKLLNEIADYCKCRVRLYDLEPMMLLMIFQDSIFTEQYHLGRPDSLRAGSCIGKQVPVIEFSSTAIAAGFYREHFETIWKKSRDITLSMFQEIKVNT